MRAYKKVRLKPLLLSLVIGVTSSLGIAQAVFAAPTTSTNYTPPSLGMSQNLNDALHAHQEYLWLKSCFDHIDIDAVKGNAEMDGWAWFEGSGATSDINGSGDPSGKIMVIGNSEGGGDLALQHCDTGSNVGAAFQTLGFTDARKFFCELPGAKWNNAGGIFDQNNPQDMIDCEQNVDGKDWDNDHVSQSTVLQAFEKNIQATAAGKAAAAGLDYATQYLRYIQAFQNECDPTYISDYSSGNGQTIGGKFYNLSVVDENGNVNHVYTYGKDSGTPVALYAPGDTTKYTGDNQTGYGTVYDCGQIAAGAQRTAAAYANYAQNHKNDITAQDLGTTNDGSGGGGNVDVSCGGFFDTSSVGSFLTSPLRWLVCPMIQGFSGAASVLDNGINSMLCINESQIFDTSAKTACSGSSDAQTVQAYKAAWNVFRIIALGLLAIAGLIMILSQTMGLEFIDAYTIKKVLPRLVVAAIGVTLSWQLMEFFVGLTNLLGLGIRSLIYTPFTHAGINSVTLGGGGSAVGLLTTGGAIVLLGPLGILSLVATGLLAILVAFVVLVLRNLVVILLILTAPVAIVAYVLPNTQKVWAFWWDAFSKALMMFPIITAFIAVGRVFAAISTTQADNLSGVAALISNIVGFIAYFAPYFLIPLTLRFAGGALGTLGGFANDRSRGAFDRLKKFRGNRAAQNMNAMKNFSRFSENSAAGRAMNTTLGAASNPSSMLRGRRGVAARKHDLQTVQGQNAIKESAIWQANAFDDNFHLAVADRELAIQKLNAARSNLASATTTEEQGKYQAEVNAREKGLDSASQIPFNVRNTRATKLAALDALTKTGYQYDAGLEGYQELQNSVRNIVGNDDRAYAKTMDSSQFNLKQAGRAELGGINHGDVANQRKDMKMGIRKLNNYQRGSGKTPMYHGGAEAWLGTSVNYEKDDASRGIKKGDRKSTADMAADLQAAVTRGDTSLADVAEWHSMMANDYSGANDTNKVEINKQMEAIQMMAQPVSKSPRPLQESEQRFLDSLNHNNRIKERGVGIDPSERDKL